jgi:hypothetical protein
LFLFYLPVDMTTITDKNSIARFPFTIFNQGYWE